MDAVWRDLRYGFRTLLRTPGFTAVAILSLALGIGANTAIFTLTNAVFLKPLPVEDPARVLQVFTVDHATTVTAPNLARTPMSFPNYRDFRDLNHVFSGLAAFLPIGVTLTGRGEPQPETAMLVSANYFDLLGVKPAIGRTFAPGEDRQEGGNTVAVLSYAMWVRFFGADPAAIGKTIDFNSIPYTVIGVAPPGFKGTQTVAPAELAFVPISMHAQILPGALEALYNERRMRMINVFGRLLPGVTPERADAALRTIAAGLEREYPRANNGRSTELSSLTEAALGFLPRRQLLTAGLALSGVVAVVLLIACLNLANLLLARSARRMREMGIRTAMGAERGRLIRQLLTESLLIAAAGGVIGWFLGTEGARLLWSFRPTFLPADSLPVQTDWRVFAFTAAVTVATSLVFGLAPAVRASLSNLSEVLKSGGRAGAESFSRSPLRSALVVGEVSLALIALAAAGLLVRSMDGLEKINPGFETANLFVFDFDIGARHYSPERGHAFYRAVLDQAHGVRGVAAVSLSTNRPLGGGLLATLLAEGQESDPNQRGVLTLLNTVTPGYFDTMRIPVIAGRGFTEFDRAGSARVAVITEAMARHFWPGQNAIGKRFRKVIDNNYVQVVGICANSAQLQIGEQPQPVAYLPLDQDYQSAVTLHVRTLSNPGGLLPAVRRQVQSLDGDLALTNPATVGDLVTQGLWAPHIGAALFGLFGLLALVLASIGIYGVMAYLVAQRTSEIGLRMALGARPWDVLRVVVGQGMRLVTLGILAGIGCGLLVTRLIAGLLFDIPTYDPATFITVTALVAAVALVAAAVPARRAARIDPVLALRQD